MQSQVCEIWRCLLTVKCHEMVCSFIFFDYWGWNFESSVNKGEHMISKCIFRLTSLVQRQAICFEFNPLDDKLCTLWTVHSNV
jgi:hypothetical protein